MTRLPDHRTIAYDDDLTDVPSGGFWPKWFGGVVVPLVLIGLGVSCVITRHGMLVGEHGSMVLDGTKAVVLGVAYMAVGLFLHCHYFWGNIYRVSIWASVGKIVSAAAFIGAMGYLIVRVGVYGR